MKFKHYIYSLMVTEAAYPNNLGFEELIKFYQVANPAEIKKLEKAIRNEDWQEFKQLIKDVIGVSLH